MATPTKSPAAPPERHPAELRARVDAVEVGVHDAEQQGGLEGLAQGEDEGGAHRYSATMRPLAVFSWYSPTSP